MTNGVQNPQPTAIKEEIWVRGGQLVDTVKNLVAAGNVRAVVVKHDGKPVVEFPLTVGVIGTLIAPQLAGLGAIAALLTECSVEVIRTTEPS